MGKSISAATAFLAAAALTATILTACAQGSSPAMPYRLAGKVRDATTGEAISRRTMYVHFFCDDARFQKSLDPEDESGFDVDLPTPNVRIRVSDKERTYAFLTETFTLDSPAVTRDIRLQPTGYVLLRAQVVDPSGAPLVPPRPRGGNTATVGGGGPLFALVDEHGKFNAGMIGLDEGGRFEEKVPRSLLRVLVVDTALAPVEPLIDLSKAEGPSFDYVLKMK